MRGAASREDGVKRGDNSDSHIDPPLRCLLNIKLTLISPHVGLLPSRRQHITRVTPRSASLARRRMVERSDNDISLIIQGTPDWPCERLWISHGEREGDV